MNDGCTLFNWAEKLWPIRGCCDAHDAGGGLWELFVCLVMNTPAYVWLPLPFICFVGVPLYMHFRRK